MEPRKTQLLAAALLAAALPLAAGSGWAGDGPSPSPTVTPSPSPSPSPTPRLIEVSLHFRRPARVIPWQKEEGAAEVSVQDFEIADETPWLTGADVRRIGWRPEDRPELMRLYLNRDGIIKYGEARMGNLGRKIILVIDGTVRSVVTMEPVREKDQIDFPGGFSVPELKRLQAQIAFRPPPPPTPALSPTPAKRERFIIR